METIKDKVTFIVAEQLGLNESEVTPDKSFMDLGGDSLDHVELLMAIEDEFGINIPDKDFSIDTVQKAIDYVTRVQS